MTEQQTGEIVEISARASPVLLPVVPRRPFGKRDAWASVVCAGLLGMLAAISAWQNGASPRIGVVAAAIGGLLGCGWSRGHVRLWIIGACAGALAASALGGNVCDGSLYALPAFGAAIFSFLLKAFRQHPIECDDPFAAYRRRTKNGYGY